MRTRLACCNRHPWRPVGGKCARLAATSVCGEFGGNANDLQCKEWRDSLAGNPLALAHQLIAQQDDRARPITALIGEW